MNFKFLKIFICLLIFSTSHVKAEIVKKLKLKVIVELAMKQSKSMET